MSNVLYELKMFSSNLSKDPEFIAEGMKCILKMEGYDEEGVLRKVKIEFDSVLAYKKTSARFTPKLYGAYDKLVELIESGWLKELEKINKEDASYCKPRHFVLYLDEIGMYEVIGRDIKISEAE